MNDWLANPIYKGELVWEKYPTGGVDDRRMLDKNLDDRALESRGSASRWWPPTCGTGFSSSGCPQRGRPERRAATRGSE